MSASREPAADRRKLNIGSGHYPDEAALNVDVSLVTGPDVVTDLSCFPYPFGDGQFQAITASHVLEHLPNPLRAMAELHRILAPGGTLEIKVPHFSRGFTNPDHKAGFDVSFPLYFDPAMPPWYCGTSFELRRMRLRWSGQAYLKSYVLSPPSAWLANAVGRLVDAIANLSPMVFSRIFSFWVGGFEEIEFTFVKTDG